MPVPPSVIGQTSLTQRVQTVLENSANNPGEQLLYAYNTVTGSSPQTISLTTQPNTLCSQGMHLHFYIIGNTAAGTVGIVGTDQNGNSQTSITYHVPIAPLNNQGYNEFTTKETWGTVTSSSITLTTLTPCTVMIFGTYAAKYLLPITAESEEKIPKHSPADKRGILWKNLRITQLTKSVSLDKFDADLYPDALYIPYTLISNTPSVATVPASPVSLMSATNIAATMTLTTGLATVAPGMFLIFTLASNTATGTIVLSGNDIYGNAQSETITFTSAAAQTLYSKYRYSSINNAGANKFATTGGTSSTVAVTAVFAWTYTFTWDGLTNLTPYSQSLEVFDGVFGYCLPGTILTDGTFDWQKEKEILFSGKGEAQDFLIVGDNTSTTGGTNPFNVLAQPQALPYTSWPGTFYIDADNGGTAFTTQDGTFETFKLAIMTGRKWKYTGDGMQRPNFVVWDSEPDYSLDATIVLQNYANYVNYFKPNAPLILGAQFQGTLLGASGSNVYYETIKWTLPCKVDTFKEDHSKNPVEGALKLMASYDFGNLGYAYKCAWTCQVPPVYTS